MQSNTNKNVKNYHNHSIKGMLCWHVILNGQFNTQKKSLTVKNMYGMLFQHMQSKDVGWKTSTGQGKDRKCGAVIVHKQEDKMTIT